MVNSNQCLGYDPMDSITGYLGAELDYDVADHICCHNHRYAEYRGYLASPEVDLFSRLDPSVETTFYDSVCGIPLFIAPRNRTFEEFKEESLHHGWPSFRPEEMVSENVIIHPDGRMESKCLTHLGHNLPKDGIDRYCIDLVCIAGKPLNMEENSEILIDMKELSIIPAEEFDQSTYVSSAEQWSGKYNNIKRNSIISAITLASIALVVTAACYIKRSRARKNEGKSNGNDVEHADGVTDGSVES